MTNQNIAKAQKVLRCYYNIDKFKITNGNILYYNNKRIGLLKAKSGEYKTIFTHQKFNGVNLISQDEHRFKEHIYKSDFPESSAKANVILYQKIYDIISQNEVSPLTL